MRPVDLSDNTNRWGMAPAVEQALRDFAVTGLARYPDAYAAPLKEAIALYCAVDAERVVTGCGSDDVLDSAFRAFASPGERLASISPSFTMIPVFAALNHVECVQVPLLASWDIDADALLATRARVTYLCSPNNPTGTVASRAQVLRVVDNAPGVVIIDEAYAEFTDDNFLDLARTRPNVLVVRTFSKAFGLAGLRVGYGIGSPALVRAVERSRGPFKVTAFASAGAIAALGPGLAWMRTHANLARDARATLATELLSRGIESPLSHANFVYAPIADPTGVAQDMLERGVAVRAFPGALRITVGPAGEIAHALGALDTARLACA